MLCYPTNYRYSYSRLNYTTIYAVITALNSLWSALIEGIQLSVDQLWQKTLRKVQQKKKKSVILFTAKDNEDADWKGKKETKIAKELNKEY